MANQLETLIETQSLLAQVDTRQRLARDLHDSTKQQLFAASMQLSATQLLTAVRQILTGFTQQHQITADLNSTITTPISADIENGLFRILQESLSNIASFTVLGEAENGSAAVQLAAQHAPDVVLMDLIMPGMDGITATRELKKVNPRSQIIILTSFHEDAHIFPAIRAEALSYLLKDVDAQELIKAIQMAAKSASKRSSGMSATSSANSISTTAPKPPSSPGAKASSKNKKSSPPSSQQRRAYKISAFRLPPSAFSTYSPTYL